MSLSSVRLVLLVLISFPCFGAGLTYKEGAHIPLLILLDQEGIEESSETVAATYALNLALKESGAAILVSRSLLNNLIKKNEKANRAKSKANEEYYYIRLTSGAWELYKPENLKHFNQNNQLYLLIPKAEKDKFITAFRYENLKELKILPPSPIPAMGYPTAYSGLKKEVQFEGKKKEQEMGQKLKNIREDLEKIFVTIPSSKEALPLHKEQTWQAPIFDIYLLGHGSKVPPILADLNLDEMNVLLKFFNNKLRLGILLISSCYGGGTNLRTFGLTRNKDNELNALNFIVILNSVGDIPTTISDVNVKEQLFKHIFNIAAHLGQKPSFSLESLLNILTGSFQSIHKEKNIPQIILPGGLEIQSLTPSKNVMVLGKVKATAAELEKKPIYVYPQKADEDYDEVLNLLVYPQSIMVPIIMRASNIHLLPLEAHRMAEAWENLPTFAEIVTKHPSSFAKECKTQAGLFSNAIDTDELIRKDYLYPNVLSMIHGPASHYFDKIIFEGNALDGSGGIIKGLRDAFGNLAKRETVKKFYIRTVEGSNDLSLILKSLRCLNKDVSQSALERLLPADGKKIALENVYIETTSYPLITNFNPMKPEESSSYAIDLVLKFQINETAWAYTYKGILFSLPTLKSKQKLWDFKPIEMAEYQNSFQKAVDQILSEKLSAPEQKTIAQVLKEKINRQLYRRQTSINSLIELTATLGSLSLK